jgi:hypothetical protein
VNRERFLASLFPYSFTWHSPRGDRLFLMCPVLEEHEDLTERRVAKGLITMACVLIACYASDSSEGTVPA